MPYKIAMRRVLSESMRRLSSETGETQIARLLRVALGERVSGVVFVGDHCEEKPGELLALAATLGQRSMPLYFTNARIMIGARYRQSRCSSAWPKRAAGCTSNSNPIAARCCARCCRAWRRSRPQGMKASNRWAAPQRPKAGSCKAGSCSALRLRRKSEREDSNENREIQQKTITETDRT